MKSGDFKAYFWKGGAGLERYVNWSAVTGFRISYLNMGI